MIKNKVDIIGAGGHCRSLLPLVEASSYAINGIFDSSYCKDENEIILGVYLKGTLLDLDLKSSGIILAVGDNLKRKEYYKDYICRVVSSNIIAKESLIRKSAKLGEANQIFPFAFINSLVNIGYNNIINSRAIIEHESKIGNHCHISIGAIVAGRVTIGNLCFIGAGAVIKDGISICDNVTIGAGAVVVKDVLEPGTYIGNPLKKIK